MIPTRDMETYAPFIRLLGGVMMSELMTEYKPLHPVMLMLDEAKLLGKLEQLTNIISAGAGYGIKAVTIWQSLTQIQENFGTHKEILENSGLAVFFSVEDMDLAKHLSELSGRCTVRTRSYGVNGRTEHIINGGHNYGEGEAGRPVLYPSDFMNSKEMFVKIRQMPLLRCAPMPYYAEKRYAGMYGEWRGRKPRPDLPPDLAPLSMPVASKPLQIAAPHGWIAPQNREQEHEIIHL